MSNYANTKATIAANVYENHLNQVTANMAKSAINAVVDTLIAGGFIYKGVATTSTNPGSPDANVFYIATASGTYTNFGSLVVNDGEVAILKYNGSWSKEVTGAATAAEVTALGQDVDGQNQEIAAFEETITNQIDNFRPIVIEGNVVNAPDQEDITTDENDLLKFANRGTLHGMGYFILRRDKTFAEQVTLANTIYEIRYDFDLNGASVTIPAGCVLKFVGGMLGGGTITGTNTGISASPSVKIFSNSAILGGTWDVNIAYAEWFDSIKLACTYFRHIQLLEKTYNISSLTIEQTDAVVEIFGMGKNEITTIRCSDDGIRLNKRCVLRDFYITTPLGSTARTNGVGVFVSASSCRLERLSIYTFKNGIEYDKTKSTINEIIFDCGVSYCRQFGIVVDSTTVKDGFQIRGNYVVGIGSSTYAPNTIDPAQKDTQIGIYVSGGINIDISDNITEYCNGAGIKVDSKSYTLSGLTMFNNYAENNKYAGFALEKYTNPISSAIIKSNRGILAAAYQTTGSTGISGLVSNERYLLREIEYDNSSVFALPSLFGQKEKQNLFPFDTFKGITNGAFREYIESDGLAVVYGNMPPVGNEIFKLSPGRSYMVEMKVASMVAPSGNHSINFYTYKNDGTVAGIGSRSFNSIGVLSIQLTNPDTSSGRCYFQFTDVIPEKYVVEYIHIYPIEHVFEPYTASPAFEDGAIIRKNGVFAYRDNSKWHEPDTATLGVNRRGTFANKPAAADIYVGFGYFCTDRQTTEGQINGIMIYHKGSDVWVDALGRVVS